MEEITVENISRQVEESALKHYGPMFKFRPHQKEAIVNTVYNWLTGQNADVILQGPTGSGKSAIGLLAAAVLSEFYGKKGYILISDLSLLDQYQRDVEKYFNSPKWALIKGQHAYKCFKNNLPFNSGLCKMNGCKSYKEIYIKYRGCAHECEYLVERSKAMESSVLVCTYSFWLIQQNKVNPMLGEGMCPFEKRDFVICDEAHKLVDIVQSHFSPTIYESDTGKIRNIIENAAPDDADIIDMFDEMYSKIAHDNSKESILKSVELYHAKLKIAADAADAIEKSLAAKCESKEKMNKEDRILAANSRYIKEQTESFGDYISVINNIGTNNLVKTTNNTNIVLNCIDESYLMGKFFHANCNYKMYMSATIGDPAAYAKYVAIDRHFDIDIPSTFNFEKSPIFYVSDYKMSYREKDASLPKVIEMITKVCEMYSGQRGIIQTGSYNFAKSVLDSAPEHIRKRLVPYNDSKEKDDAISLFKFRKDKILIGPTLVEGLSFDDDLCRFLIIMKIPYPSLADNLVKEKKDINPEWYSNETAISMLQGIGRGIRSESDWCVTFILDGCFTYLMSESGKMFPPEFGGRIRLITPSALGVS